MAGSMRTFEGRQRTDRGQTEANLKDQSVGPKMQKQSINPIRQLSGDDYIFLRQEHISIPYRRKGMPQIRIIFSHPLCNVNSGNTCRRNSLGLRTLGDHSLFSI